MKDSSHYNLSISDLLMGFLFVFILVLMKFMIEYRDKKSGLLKPLEERIKLLEYFEEKFQDKGIDVEADKENGVLKLRSLHYFKSCRYDLNEKGKKDFCKIKNLFEILVCYSDLNNPGEKNRWKFDFLNVPIHHSCEKGNPDKLKQKFSNKNNIEYWKKYCLKKGHRDKNGLIDSILIEGHADRIPIGDNCRWYEDIKTNMDLAMKRSQTVFEFLLDYEEATVDDPEEYGNHFYSLVNKQGKPLFGVTSYGNLRRNFKNEKGRNATSPKTDRRIDIRFIMSPSEDVREELKNSLKRDIKK